MSGDGWGSSFHIGHNTLIKEYETLPSNWPVPEVQPPDGVKQPWPITPIGAEKHSKVWSSLDQIADEKFPYGKPTNKVPTHDPYTNPDAQLYYSCNCGAILDPGTKRFAELNNYASRAGWKIRFSDSGYVPYCVECGKGVE